MSIKNKILAEGLTYDDVLVVPSYSEILPKEVITETYFSKNIKLNILLKKILIIINLNLLKNYLQDNL